MHLVNSNPPISPHIFLVSLVASRMSLFAPVPPPQSPLARYRVLSPLCSLRVSPIQLGGMSVGAKSKDYGLGEIDKEGSFKLLDKFFDLGGNFIDTANS